MWHPQAGGPRAAARRGQGHGVPGDRLRPARREPLHEPPLLGGRRARRPDAARAGWGATSTSPAIPATRCRASRSTTRSPRRWRPRRCPSPPSPRPSDYGFWAYGLGEPLTSPTLDDVRRARRARGALAGVRAGARRVAATRASSATRSRRSANTKANPASPRRSPTRPPAASSRRGWRRSRRCSTTKHCRSNASR